MALTNTVWSPKIATLLKEFSLFFLTYVFRVWDKNLLLKVLYNVHLDESGESGLIRKVLIKGRGAEIFIRIQFANSCTGCH